MRPIELPLGWPTILRTVIDGPELWATPAEIVDRTPLKSVYGKRRTALKIVAERCREMIAAGWLEGSVDGADAVVTLSLSAADRLGVCISDDGRWEGFDLRRLPSVRYYSFTPERLSVFFEVPDPQPDPCEAAIEREELELAARPSEAAAPLSGAHQTGPHWIWPWRRDECDDCRGVRLADGRYCMACGRSWWENG